MERNHSVMKRAHDVVLHPEELNILHYSMYSVHIVISDRVEKLQGKYSYLLRLSFNDLQWLVAITAIYKLHNVKERAEIADNLLRLGTFFPFIRCSTVVDSSSSYLVRLYL